jgi:DNA primase
MFVNQKTGMYYCFSCGAKGGIDKLCLQLDISVIEHSEDFTTEVKLKDEQWIGLLNSKIDITNKYLIETRHLRPNTIRHFGIRSFEGGVFIPCYNSKGVCTGGQIRHYEGIQRYKKVGYGEIYPLENLTPSCDLVEGVFGVFNLWQQNIMAVTGYGAQALVNNKHWLLTLQRLDANILFDDDNAGYEAAGNILKNAPFLKVMVKGCEADEYHFEPGEHEKWCKVRSYGELQRWLKYNRT